MKILIVVHEFPCDGGAFHGGIAAFYQNLSLVLKRYGNDVAVITLSREYDDSDLEPCTFKGKLQKRNDSVMRYGTILEEKVSNTCV